MIAPEQQVLTGPLALSIGQDGQRRIVSLKGELDLANVQPVQIQIEEALADRECEILILDMKDLEFIDSSGVAVLLQTLQSDRGDRLRVIPSEAVGVAKVLDLTGVGERLVLLDATAETPT